MKGALFLIRVSSKHYLYLNLDVKLVRFSKFEQAAIFL